MRITCSCPEALLYEGNQLAMALGFSEADGETYRGLNWQDAQGNLYAAASFEASEAWLERTQQSLTRPAWDTAEVIDMVAAERAQAALVFSTEPTPADPARLTAIGGMEGPAALAAMGLTPAEEATDAA